MPEKCEGWSRYQNSTGSDSPKSALKTEDHVPRPEHIDSIMCVSSGTIWERTSPQRDTSLPLLWRRSDGKEQSVSSSGMLRTGTNTTSSRTRNISPSTSSITTRTTRFMLKRPLRCNLRVQGRHHTSYVMVWWEVLHPGVTHLHFSKKRAKLLSRVYQADVLQGDVKQQNMTFFSGQEWVFQQDPFLSKRHDDSGVVA